MSKEQRPCLTKGLQFRRVEMFLKLLEWNNLCLKHIFSGHLRWFRCFSSGFVNKLCVSESKILHETSLWGLPLLIVWQLSVRGVPYRCDFSNTGDFWNQDGPFLHSSVVSRFFHVTLIDARSIGLSIVAT